MKFSNLSKNKILHLGLLIVLFIIAPIAATAQEEADAVKLFNQGQDAQEKGDLSTAVKFYQDAIKAAPEFPEAEYQMGSALFALGKIGEAESAFRRAAELRAEWNLPLIALGNLLIQKKSYAEAEKFLNQARALDDKNAATTLAVAELRLQTNAAPESLKTLLSQIENLLTANNSSAVLWTARGRIENALGLKIEALKSLRQALTIDPRNTSALFEQTALLAEQKYFPAALADARKLVELNSDSLAAKILLAQVLAASGDLPEALKILESLDDSIPAVLTLKNSLATVSSVDVAALEKQAVADGKNAVVLGRLCNLLRVSDPAKALDYCRRASEAEPDNIGHAVGYGAALVQAKQFAPAIDLLRKLIIYSPDNYAAHANLATALFQSSRFQEAAAEYQWMIAKKPDLAIAYFFLAISNDKVENYSEAKNNYLRFLQLADINQNRLEIEKVNLRMPALEKLIKQKGSKK